MASSPQSAHNSEHKREHRQHTEGEHQKNEPKVRKVWNIDDPFEFAPPKPNGDPWMLLLEPRFKRDKIRCDSWKDEVQNLLIFAGLFSAVVTTFIVESYKGLQRDTNADIVNLLSHLVIQLDSPVNNTNLNFSSILTPFSPTASSIRINIFWILSLVLSLTTVLAGIISLQWLREHQNYTDLTPRQQFAIFNMREESIEKWHVRKVFTAMPLLLQFALVFFLTGLVDFLQSFGHAVVVIPVSAAVGITLLFLIATTVLPTLQGLALLFSFSSSDRETQPPVQCPYKSPQTYAVRVMLLPIHNLVQRLYPRMRIISHRIRCFVFKQLRGCSDELPLAEDKYATYITYSRRTWPGFDLNWLEIRDGYMRRAYRRSVGWNLLGQETNSFTLLPLWDLIQGLVSETFEETSPAYHAFSELCDIAHRPLQDHAPSELSYCQNAYLHDILARNMAKPDVCLSDFYEPNGHRDIFWYRLVPALKHQNLFAFLSIMDKRSPLSYPHRQELQLRLLRYLYQYTYPIRHVSQQGPLPLCLVLVDMDSFNQQYHALSAEEYFNFSWQTAQVALAIFEAICDDESPESLINMPCARRDGLNGYMTAFSHFSTQALPWLGWGAPFQRDHATTQAFDFVLVFVMQRLEHEMSSLIVSGTRRPSLLFYVATIFVQHAEWMIPRGTSSSFDSLHSTICRYKRMTLDTGRKDTVIEEQLTAVVQDSLTGRLFSTYWWSLFEARNCPNASSDPEAEDISGHGIDTVAAQTQGISPLVESPSKNSERLT